MNKKKELLLTQSIATDSNMEMIHAALERIADEERKIKDKIDMLIGEVNSDYKKLSRKEKLLFFAQIYARINVALGRRAVILLKKSKYIAI